MARPQLKISVPKPCAENWNAMTPQTQGRFCASCATTVIDFSQFTDQQLLEYFANPSGKICGRFTASQLGRTVYAETLLKQNIFPRFVTAAALFLGVSSQTQAQHYYNHPTPSGQIVEKKVGEENPSKTVSKTPEKVSGDNLVISGRLVDGKSGDPIAFGNVVVKGTRYYCSTDTSGMFNIIIPDKNDLKKVVIITPNAGYLNNEIILEKDLVSQFLEIQLEQMEHKNEISIVMFGLPLLEYSSSPEKNINAIDNDPNHLKMKSDGGVSPNEKRKTPGYSLRNFWWKTKNFFRKNDQH